MLLIVVAGPAGSGKSTLANALAARLHVQHLDFDAVTRPLVETRRRQNPDLSEPALLEQIKGARYEMLAMAVRDLEAREVAVVSAPFTEHASTPTTWTSWLRACGEVETVMFVWLTIEPQLRLARMRARKSSRDAHILTGGEPVLALPVPVIDHLPVDASRPRKEQVAQVVEALPQDTRLCTDI